MHSPTGIRKRDYLSKCWESAKYHWLVSVVAALLFVYGLVSDYGNLVNLPIWLKVDNWPKLPLSWATAIVFAALFFIAVEGGVRFHRETLTKFTDEAARLKNDLENVGGPELFIEYHGFGVAEIHPPLVVVNNGGGIAYSVVLKIPEDGSKIKSAPINILHPDKSPTMMRAGPTARLDAADVVLMHAQGLPFVVECKDGDCRKFVYQFEQPGKAGSGFTLKNKRCIGKD